MTTAIANQVPDRITRARLVPLGLYGREAKGKARAKPRAFIVELTFSTGSVRQVGKPTKVRRLGVAYLRTLLDQARKMGLDGRPVIRAQAVEVAA